MYYNVCKFQNQAVDDEKSLKSFDMIKFMLKEINVTIRSRAD